MDPRQAGRDRIVGRQYVADAAAERIHQVFFRMAIGREIDPLAPAALAAVVLKRLLQMSAARMDEQVAGVQKALDGVEPVQHQVHRPPGEDSRAKHPLVFGVSRRAQRRSSRRGRVDANLINAAATGELIGQRLDGAGIFQAHDILGVVIAEHRHPRPVGPRIRADLEEHRRGVPRRSGIDGAADEVRGVVLGVDRDVPGRIEPGKPDAVGGLEKLGVDLLSSELGIFIQADNLREKLFRQVRLVGVRGIGRLDGGRVGEDSSENREPARRGRDQRLRVGAGPQRQHRQVPG